MGLTTKKFIVKASFQSPEKIDVDFMIDSGAIYSLVPKVELQKLGIIPYRKMEFFLADGTKITREVGDAYFEYQGSGGAATGVFCEFGDETPPRANAL